MRDPYDGKPYFCTTCGEYLVIADCPSPSECKLETLEAAQARAAKKRNVGSDLASAQKTARDAA